MQAQEKRLPRIYFPAPEVYSGPDQCNACSGTGITGEQYAMPVDTAVIVADVICALCGGCGRAEHLQCRSDQHVDWEPFDYEEDGFTLETYQDDENVCRSCHGRKWNALQGFTNDSVEYLRMPCGCATPDMVTLPDLQDSENR